MAQRRGTLDFEEYERLQRELPVDYHDALLDEDYMKQLIEATDAVERKRQAAFLRYRRMHRWIFIALILYGLAGVFIALFRTILQPNFLFTAEGNMTNVDMVMMLDAAEHNHAVMPQQQQTVSLLSEALFEEVKKRQAQTKQEIKDRIVEKQANETNPITKLLGLQPEPKEMVHVHGGWLRIRTGVYNKEPTMLHPFTRDAAVQKESLGSVKEDSYKATTEVMKGLDACARSMREDEQAANHWSGERFCVLIGDAGAQCERRSKETDETLQAVDELCELWPEQCPQQNTVAEDSHGVLETAQEFLTCSDYVNSTFRSEEINMKLILLLVVESDTEAQFYLRNKGYRNFIQNSTGCNIQRKDEVINENGRERVEGKYIPPDDLCTNSDGAITGYFIMGNFDVLNAEAKKLAKLLKDNSKDNPEPNKQKDWKFLFFMLTMLNPIFFVAWSCIIQMVSKARARMQRRMGKKKKLVKVTKRVVEKPRRDSVQERYVAQMTEVELAEMKAADMRPPATLGDPMTLRARLRGALLHKSGEEEVNGKGQQGDPACIWNFEAVEPTGEGEGPSGLRVGEKVRVKSGRGGYLKVDSDGARIVPEEGLDPADESTFFRAELVAEEEQERAMVPLCGFMRLASEATGKYVKVNKDGKVDGVGEGREPETQFVVDRGGRQIVNGGVVTLTSVIAHEALAPCPETGRVAAAPHLKEWRHLLITKTRSSSSNSQANTQDDTEAGVDALGNPLKVGDVVTLKSFTQNGLSLDSQGKLRAGKPDPVLAKFIQEQAGAAAASSSADDDDDVPENGQEFIIDRFGMGLVVKTDNSIRQGMEICLRPVPREDGGLAGLGNKYVRLNDEDTFATANGKATDPHASFIIEISPMQSMIDPLTEPMYEGDVDLLVKELWDKQNAKHYEALSAAWTNDEDLGHFKGQVVVVQDDGSYTVPKNAAKEGHGWVAVAKEGINIRKAAAQAKQQGATGFIVHCEEVFSLEKLAEHAAATGDEVGAPVLPTVFVNKEIGKALQEVGLTLDGAQFRQKYLTEAMRALGRAAIHSDSPGTQGDLHHHFGNGALEIYRKKIMEPKVEMKQQEVPVMGEDQGNYKWKVQSNTMYYWSASGGGATKVNVNFGKVAPPSAHKEQKHRVDPVTGELIRVSVDAGHDKAHVHQEPQRTLRTTTVFVEGEDFKSKRLGFELSEVLEEEEPDMQNLEQLAEESDFKIEYNFDTVEVEIGTNLEELGGLEDDEELQDREGSVVDKVAVPAGQFWLVALGLFICFIFVALLLIIVLRKPQTAAQEPLKDPWDDPDYVPGAAASGKGKEAAEVLASISQAGLRSASALARRRLRS